MSNSNVGKSSTIINLSNCKYFMERSFYLALILFFHVTISYSQDVFDLYKSRHSDPPPFLSNQNIIYPFEYTTSLDECNYYDGEYEIVLDKLFWISNLFSSPICISFQYELVSFPFVIDCAFTGGCGYNCSPSIPLNYSDERKLSMPEFPGVYSSIDKAWIYPQYGGFTPILYIQTPLRKFFGQASSDGNNPGHVLASRAFSSNTLWYDSRANLPHSILKVNLNLHCGSDITGTIINSLSFVYDNTRGRMRFYPFYESNCNQANLVLHDQVFRPELLFNLAFDQYEIPPFDIIINEFETLNYFKFENIDNGACSGLAPIDKQDYFFTFPPFYYYFPYESPRTLYTTSLRQSQGEELAGYVLDAGQLIRNSNNQNLKHEYFINHEIDFTILNPSEKVIYNPSEVSIDPDIGDPANNNPPIVVIFPTGYTFKTVLGRYPSVQQVEDANLDLQNGGYYTDLRQVPVPVNAADLPQSSGSTAADYPEVMWDDPMTVDVNGFYDEERFGYYYIRNKSTLRVENCVRLFDARFSVDAGGTMIFDDYSGILGYEDTDANLGRYKIRGEGGAILRNYASIQYVQNGEIEQPNALEYIALNAIISGNDVDPNTEQPDGKYKLHAGSNVTFRAGDYIHLTDCFSVQGGDFHAVIDENIAVPVPCFNPNAQNGGNRLGNTSAIDSGKNSHHDFLQVSPNPTTGDFKLTLQKGEMINEVLVFNSIGQQVYKSNQEQLKEVTLSLSDSEKGLYLVQVLDHSGNVYRRKVIIQN